MREKGQRFTGGQKYARGLFQFVLIVAVLLAIRYGFVRGYLSQASIQSFVKGAGILAVPTFILLLVLGLMTFAPSPLLVGSGALAFGKTIGAVYSSVGITLGACVAFLLGRYVARDFAQKQKQGRWKKIDEWVELNGLGFMVSLRLALFANPALSYVAGLTPMKFRDYVLGNVIGLLPGVFAVSYAFDEWTRAASLTLMDMLVDPVFLSLGLLRLAGVVLFIVLAKRDGKGFVVRDP